MATQKHKELIRELTEELWNKGNLGAIDKYYSNDVVAHAPTGKTKGLDSYKQQASMFREAYPDATARVGVILAEDELAAYTWTFEGTHRGPFGDIQPTGKHISVDGVSVVRFKNGKIVEEHSQYDFLGGMSQIGAVDLPDFMKQNK